MSTPPSEEIAVFLQVPMDMWADELLSLSWVQEAERMLADIAAGAGMEVIPDQRSDRFEFGRFAEEGDDIVLFPCVQEEAEVVTIRRSAWARPRS